MSGRQTPVASGKQVKSRIGKAAGEKTGEKAGEKPRKVQPGSRPGKIAGIKPHGKSRPRKSGQKNFKGKGR
jgi:hypothetical protein